MTRSLLGGGLPLISVVLIFVCVVTWPSARAVVVTATPENIDDIVDERPFSVIVFCPSNRPLVCSEEFMSRFSEASEVLKDKVVLAKAIASDSDLIQHYEVTVPRLVPGFRYFREGLMIPMHGLSELVAYAQLMTNESFAAVIEDWMNETPTPPALMDALPNWRRMAKRGLPIATLFFDDSNLPSFLSLYSWLSPIALSHYGEISFAYLGKSSHHQVQFSSFGTTGNRLPILAITDTKKKNWPFPENMDFTAANVESFLNQFKEGSATQHVRTEKEPENNSGPVKIAVATTFDKLVMQNDKNVLVEFYAPWCKHCKRLDPIYQELGEFFKNEEKVSIVKMDASANDVPSGISVPRFPTIYMFPASNKNKPIQLRSYPTIERLKGFVVAALQGEEALHRYEQNQASPIRIHDEL